MIGLQPWYYDIGSNCKNIATHLSKQNRVLYVNLPINRKTFLGKTKNAGIQKHCDIIRNKEEKIRPIHKDMWELYPSAIVESINWIPWTPGFKAVNYFNNRRFARNIRDAVKQLGFRDIILFNDNDIFNGFYLKELLKPSMYIYYVRDFLQGYPYWKKHCSVLEPQLIRKSDLVVTNSTYYAEYCSQYNANSHYIGQGCSFDVFDAEKHHPLPDEMKAFTRPVIGYVGALDSVRLDENIIRTIAESHPEWNVVLVGPEDDFFRASSLHQITNVHFLGRKPMAQLADFVQSFDICINPQLRNQITRGNYPLKIDEYLAMGKPVVATRTETMKLFEGHTYLGDTPSDYPRLIEQVLSENSEILAQERIAFARTHTWENCLEELYRRIASSC